METWQSPNRFRSIKQRCGRFELIFLAIVLWCLSKKYFLFFVDFLRQTNTWTWKHEPKKKLTCCESDFRCIWHFFVPSRFDHSSVGGLRNQTADLNLAFLRVLVCHIFDCYLNNERQGLILSYLFWWKSQFFLLCNSSVLIFPFRVDSSPLAAIKFAVAPFWFTNFFWVVEKC